MLSEVQIWQETSGSGPVQILLDLLITGVIRGNGEQGSKWVEQVR